MEYFWDHPPAEAVLSDAEVHVWSTSLDQTAGLRFAIHTLSADERQRAERFYFDSDRHRFLAGRAVLRMILSHYLPHRPETLRFAYGPHGKPALAQDCGGRELRFNVAHSNGVALYAVTRDREVGIDVEYIRPIAEASWIARHHFSERECTELESLPARQYGEAFLHCWTRKEAYLKACGDGLLRPMNVFSVSLAPVGSAYVLDDGDHPAKVDRWSLRALTPARGYVAALCVEGDARRLSCWHWPADQDPNVDGTRD